ncbi:hypothetical protein DYB37_010676 [Aphanomyces astaci]|nr:hypothetical protein DYB25_009545 [Aphanomyces astaci]RHZ01031.1 hypothetical protein DYB35_007982 [Aphanomyces astaci]RHZ11625.1 hypothetical protein DYB37_010676 [Aphanomyces astaci]RQM11277.1 hypothetical protein B5M09_013913 [Aphanomyces astaci]
MAAGDNSYKVPHMKKEALKKSGKLPESVMCSEDVFETGHGLLADQDMALVTRELSLQTATDLEMSDILTALEKVGIDVDDADE